MIIPTDQSIARVDAQADIKYSLQPGIEDQRLTVINESIEHPVIWDNKESNVKRIKETRGISKLTAAELIWHKGSWWYQDDWYKDVYRELDLGLGDMMQKYREGTDKRV